MFALIAQSTMDLFPDSVNAYGLLGCGAFTLVVLLAAYGFVEIAVDTIRFIRVHRYMAQWYELKPYKQRAKRKAYLLKHGY